MKPHIGGQAVLEGVMIKSDNNMVVSVRNPKGKIVSMKKRLKKKSKLQKTPFVRGIVNLYDMLKLGINALVWSGNQASDEKEEITAKEWFYLIAVSILFVVAFFIALPLFLTKLITANKGVWFNLIDGVIRIIFFILYILIISMAKDIKRVFQYHGAEHKAVNCFEDGKKVIPKNCRKYSTIHARCGSSFLMIVLVISILVFSLIISENFWIKFGLRIVLIPVIISLSYEFLRLGARYRKNPVVKGLLWPGLMLQKMTTKEPDSKQLEVGIHSLKTLLKMENIKN